MPDFATPLKFNQLRWASALKIVRCARENCETEFKQKSPRHMFCDQCKQIKKPRPWQPKVRAIIDGFVVFCERHGIPSRAIVNYRVWGPIVERSDGRYTTDEIRAKLAIQLAFVMDRFRRGYYVMRKEGAVFQNPPWQPYCPVDHTYCRGAILPGDCPRRHPECAYSKTDWFTILELRGVYEIGLGKNWGRRFSWGIRRPLIGHGNCRDGKSDDACVREHAATFGDSQRQIPADGNGV